jgi:hypothetical protein
MLKTLTDAFRGPASRATNSIAAAGIARPSDASRMRSIAISEGSGGSVWRERFTLSRSARAGGTADQISPPDLAAAACWPIVIGAVAPVFTSSRLRHQYSGR